MNLHDLKAVGSLILALGGLVLMVFSGWCAILSLIVLVDLIRAGPRAADDAYRSGASLKNWWNGTHPEDSATSSSLVGRKHPKYGTVMVEERSRRPSWLRR